MQARRFCSEDHGGMSPCILGPPSEPSPALHPPRIWSAVISAVAFSTLDWRVFFVFFQRHVASPAVRLLVALGIVQSINTAT